MCTMAFFTPTRGHSLRKMDEEIFIFETKIPFYDYQQLENNLRTIITQSHKIQHITSFPLTQKTFVAIGYSCSSSSMVASSQAFIRSSRRSLSCW